MRGVRIGTLAAALLVLAVAPAWALNWSLGSNLGFSSLDMKNASNNLNVFAWPSNSYLFSPGLRVGFMGDNPMHEFYLNTGMFLVSQGSSSIHYLQGTVNYQFNMPVQGSTGPYLTGGAGFDLVGSKYSGGSESATSAVFGGGLGVRHKMGNGHGVLRAEVRYDHMVEGKDSGNIIIPETNNLGVVLGFDLWDK